MRRLISSLDPWHPVYALTFRSEDFPSYARAGDISGVDSYPIRDQESRSMKPVLDLLNAATRSGNPVWAVPQIFHAGVYRAKNSGEFAQYRAPTQEEIRAMTLLCLARGARGIVFYHYTDIFTRGEKFAPGSAPKEWAKVVEIVKDLKRVEPFVMSGISPEKIRFEQNFQVEGMLFRDGKGGAAMILCGIGPGENRALFANPATMEPESLYGLTKKRPDGKYEFKGNDIISDILIYQGKDPRP